MRPLAEVELPREILTRPATFAAAWAQNQIVGLNPLAFFAASVAVVGVVDQLEHSLTMNPGLSLGH